MSDRFAILAVGENRAPKAPALVPANAVVSGTPLKPHSLYRVFPHYTNYQETLLLTTYNQVLLP
jgi:hypothetical protein